ncbi:MAG: pilus assembly protein [Acidimicrobiales bacterium]|nr:pilus assembly protein [Acidimicrobiales bacterium]MCB9374229.1 pilus assembly protein [Microthrixaceae bacterium]
MGRLLARRRARRARGERGAALTEFVLLAPILVLIVAGVLEYGMAWRDSMTVSNALRSGARVGSNAGRERSADYDILKSIEAAMREIPDTARVQRIVVYKADTANSSPTATCMAGTPVLGLCNVYTGSDMSRPLSDFSGTTSCGGTAPDRFWCPTTRQNQQALGADYLGVWMQVKYNYLTKVFPGPGLTIKDRAIMRLEPRLDD